jgi:hypothetical protein
MEHAGIPFIFLTVTDTRITVVCHHAVLADTVRALHKAFLTHTPEPAVPRRSSRLALRS